MVFIYGLFDVLDGEIRYIGKTTNLEVRLKMHYSQKNSYITYKNSWIKKVLRNGSKIGIKLIEEVSEMDWKEREKYWISFYKNSISNLTNMADGGLGGSGKKFLINYNECKIWIKNNFNIKSKSDWFNQRNLFPNNIPKNPYQCYKNCGWMGWGDFLGTGKIQDNMRVSYLEFDEAKKFVKNLNLKSSKYWKIFANTRNFPSFLPRRPERFYSRRGWAGWGDFLDNGNIANQNKKILKYINAKELVSELNIGSIQEYKKIKLMYYGILPCHPHLTYKNKGWISYAEFFGF